MRGGVRFFFKSRRKLYRLEAAFLLKPLNIPAFLIILGPIRNWASKAEPLGNASTSFSIDTGEPVNTRIAHSIRDKILEGIERTVHLVRLVPDERLEWRPGATDFPNAPIAERASWRDPMDVGHLLGHLLDCAAGFCAVLGAVYPSQLSDFGRIRGLEVNHRCSPNEAALRLQQYSECIGRGFEFCTDEDLAQSIPTVFVPQGEPMVTLLLGNMEHLTSHKYQLFFYLRLLQVPVTSADLYRFRGDSFSR